MSRIKLGDIFEIKTSKGNAYLHFFYKDPEIGDLIRVLPRLYKKRPIDFNGLASEQEEFMIFFPLSFANKKKIVELVGHYPINEFKKPEFLRTEYYIRGEFLGWHIINTNTWKRQLVKTLTVEQKKLSPWGVWNDTLLIENLVNGWKLEDWH